MVLPSFYHSSFFNSTYEIDITMNRLDQILGKQGSKAKDVYASKISLASRVVKVERSVSIFVLFPNFGVKSLYWYRKFEKKQQQIIERKKKPIKNKCAGCRHRGEIRHTDKSLYARS